MERDRKLEEARKQRQVRSEERRLKNDEHTSRVAVEVENFRLEPPMREIGGTNVRYRLRLHSPDKLFPPSCRANKNNEFTGLCCSGPPAAIIIGY